MSSLINTAISGLNLSQLALSTTGQNIVNANTEGYSRQSVNSETLNPQFVGVGYIGTGVTASEIFRNTNDFMIDQVVHDLSVVGEFEYYLKNVSQIDNVLADPATSLSNGMDDFFAALNTASNDPASPETRQLLLTQTSLLNETFNTSNTNFVNHNKSINQQLDTYANRITNLGQSIAEMNEAISASEGISSGIFPNDLLDKRDQLVRELATIVKVDTALGSNMTIDVYIGDGQGLVIGNQASKLKAIQGALDPSRTELAFENNNFQQLVTGQMIGGELGGLIRFRDEALEPAANALGRIALAFTDALNKQQSVGVDLEGNLGSPIFTAINDPALTHNRVRMHAQNALPNDRKMSVQIDNIGELTTSDYKLDITGPGTRYSIVRLSDDKMMKWGDLGGKLPQQVSLDGFTVHFESGKFQAGDSFLIQPTKNAIPELDVVMGRPEAFALGSPVTSAAGIGNRGGAYIEPSQIYDITTPAFNAETGQLNPPVMIRFTTPTTYDVLDYSDPANPISLYPPLNNQHFSPGATNLVFPDDPEGTTVSSQNSMAAVGQTGAKGNGFEEELITFTRVDPITSFVTQSQVQTRSNQSAKDIAQTLSLVDGVKATASSALQLGNFTSDGQDAPLSIMLNGIDLTDPDYLPEGSNAPQEIPDPLGADFLRDRINADKNFIEQGVYANSDGHTLTIRSITGTDLAIEVGGNAGDSLTIRDGDLRSVSGRKNVVSGYNVSPNSSFDLDLGFGPTTVTLPPGEVSSDLVLERIQSAIDRFMGKGVVDVSLNQAGKVNLRSSDRSKVLSVTNVTDDDPLGLAPVVITGPDHGDQAAVISSKGSSMEPLDYSVQNGSFTLSLDGNYNDVITLNENYPANSGAAIVAEINRQIALSTGPSGLSQQLTAELDDSGTIRFVSSSVGVDATISISNPVFMQGLIATTTGSGQQLSGTAAKLGGGMDVSKGFNFDENGPHSFNLSVDGYPEVAVELTGTSGLPAAFSNTVDISAGVDLSAAPNSFELTLAGHPTAVIDVSGVNTTLASSPFDESPQGLVALFQQQIDSAFGVGVVSAGMNGNGRLTLTTTAAGEGASLTVSNPTGDVASDIFPVTGTANGIERGGAGVATIVSGAINAALGAARAGGNGAAPVRVEVDSNGRLTINSTSHGQQSKLTLSNVVGSAGIIFPGSDQGERFTNNYTVGGSIDVQLAEGISLNSNSRDGLFGIEPDAVSNFMGYQVALNSGIGEQGSPKVGDTFMVGFNQDGSSDNRNAVAMLTLNDEFMLGAGNLTLQSAFGQMVEQIGILTSQSRVSHEASVSLLQQSEDALQSVAGVNIDEEAALLIKLEQHYNASAQLISIARDMFDAILQL